MRVRISLQRVLKDHNLAKHGVVSKIAREADLDRAWVTQVRDGVQDNVPLGKLSRLCLWLIEHGVPSHVLPHALFDRGEVREAIDKSRWVEFYLGQKCTLEPLRSDLPADAGRFFTRKWLASDDVEAWSDITANLSLYRQVPPFKTICVPFHVAESGQPQREPQDKFEAGEQFDQLVAATDNSHVLIGSPRANLLVEHFVAHVFRHEPFVAPKGRTVPFYFRYRPGPGPVALASCMGGTLPHPRCSGDDIPGVHYVDHRLKWDCAGWTSDNRDAAVILSMQLAKSKGVTVALMGYSGRGTRWAARAFLQDTEQFRPSEEQGTRRLGVHVCYFEDGRLVRRVNLLDPKEPQPRPRRQPGAGSPGPAP